MLTGKDCENPDRCLPGSECAIRRRALAVSSRSPPSMRLTNSSLGRSTAVPTGRRLSPWWAAVIVVALALVFQLDRATGDAPVQHLYYLPIALAAFVFGRAGGVLAAL